MDKEKVVYWAPVFFDAKTDWNMMYYDLPSLYEYLRPNMVKNDPGNNLFYCPSFSNVARNTFLILNPIETHFVCDGNEIKVKSKNFIRPDIAHEPSIKDNLLVEYGMRYVFFSDEDITLTMTSPYFTQSDYMKYGAIVPGQLKIKSWFRTLNLEFNLWAGQNELIVKKEEPIAYVNFNTENVKLVRFQLNDKLHSYLNSCGTASSWESFVPLMDRYRRFEKTRMRDLVIKEIQRNLV